MTRAPARIGPFPSTAEIPLRTQLNAGESQMGTCVSAVQHLRRMRGGSQSHLLRASDGAHYVTKFMNNPQHVRVLANEMLATNLGLRLELPIPRVQVGDVPPQLFRKADD